MKETYLPGNDKVEVFKRRNTWVPNKISNEINPQKIVLGCHSSILRAHYHFLQAKRKVRTQEDLQLVNLSSSTVIPKKTKYHPINRQTHNSIQISQIQNLNGRNKLIIRKLGYRMISSVKGSEAWLYMLVGGVRDGVKWWQIKKVHICFIIRYTTEERRGFVSVSKLQSLNCM